MIILIVVCITIEYTSYNKQLSMNYIGGGLELQRAYYTELVCDLMTASVRIGLRWSKDYGKDACYPRCCSTSSSQSRAERCPPEI